MYASIYIYIYIMLVTPGELREESDIVLKLHSVMVLSFCHVSFRYVRYVRSIINNAGMKVLSAFTNFCDLYFLTIRNRYDNSWVVQISFLYDL